MSKPEVIDHAAFFAATEPLQAELDNATAHLQTLVSEKAALPAMRDDAILAGDASTYQYVTEREQALPAEMLMAEIAQAKARVRLCSAMKDAALEYRAATSEAAYRLGATAGYPEGSARGNQALQEYEGARGIVASVGQALGAAQLSLESALQKAAQRR